MCPDEDRVAPDLDRLHCRYAAKRLLVRARERAAEVASGREGLDLGRGPVGDDAPAADEHDAVGIGIGLLQVVRGEEDGPPAGSVAPDRGPERAARGHVHPRRRLVEDEERGVGQEGHGEAEPLLLAAGAFPDEAATELADTGPLENLVDRGRGREQAAREHERLPDGEVLQQSSGLHDRGHESASHGFVRRGAEDLDGPGGR